MKEYSDVLEAVGKMMKLNEQETEAFFESVREIYRMDEQEAYYFLTMNEIYNTYIAQVILNG